MEPDWAREIGGAYRASHQVRTPRCPLRQDPFLGCILTLASDVNQEYLLPPCDGFYIVVLDFGVQPLQDMDWYPRIDTLGASH